MSTPRPTKIRTAEIVVDALEVRANVELYRAAQAEALRPDEVARAAAQRDDLLELWSDLRTVADKEVQRQRAHEPASSWTPFQRAILGMWERQSAIRHTSALGEDPARDRARADEYVYAHWEALFPDTRRPSSSEGVAYLAFGKIAPQIPVLAEDRNFNRALELRNLFEYRGRRPAIEILLPTFTDDEANTKEAFDRSMAAVNLAGASPNASADWFHKLGGILRAVHEEAWEAEQRRATEARVVNARFRELITALRCGKKNGWARVADLLRALDHVVNPDAPGPLVRDYLDRSRTWKPKGRQRLAHALEVAAGRSSH